MLISGIAELLSLGAVIPFLSIITNPNSIFQNPFVRSASSIFGISEASQILAPITIIFVGSCLISSLIRIANIWLNGYLSAAIGTDLSTAAYKNILYQPYKVHLERNSSEVITKVTTLISQTTASINLFLTLVSSFFVGSSLLIGILLINRNVAIAAASIFGSAYFLLGYLLRWRLKSNGLKIKSAATKQLKTLQEGLGSIRDILLAGSQSMYLEIYKDADIPQRKLLAENKFLGTFPRYIFESLGVMFMAILGCILALQGAKDEYVITTLGAIALGAQRLLPALQSIYNSWSALKSHQAAVTSVVEILAHPLPKIIITKEKLRIKKELILNKVNFRYSSEGPYVIKSLDLTIAAGEHVGLIGTTGCGKSTLIDIIMGLLKPISGEMLIDGDNLYESRHLDKLQAWRSSIAHVPQNIYLADNTIAENIAIGVPKDEIDMNRVLWAADNAQISSYIESMDMMYESVVGERGVRLSGGQRQRLGIARALYRKASILILDEATSALDQNTERSVMNSIYTLDSHLTVILIAHRLSTLRNCHRVIKLEYGQVVSDGPPELILN